MTDKLLVIASEICENGLRAAIEKHGSFCEDDTNPYRMPIYGIYLGDRGTGRGRCVRECPSREEAIKEMERKFIYDLVRSHVIFGIIGRNMDDERLSEEFLRHENPMLWWYRNQINPIRKALGLSETDFILDAVLEMKARLDFADDIGQDRRFD